MTVLITGGTGSIGKKLTVRLKNSGFEIRVLARKFSAENDNGTSYIKGDLKETESLDKAVMGVDAVIHLAGITHTHDSKLYYKINAEGTKNLIKACQKKGVRRFIHISSRAACPEGGAYARSKLMAEKTVKESGLDWTILRPSEVYGTEKREAVSGLINIVRKSPLVPVIGNGRYSLNPVSVDDLAQSIAATLENKASFKKTYTIAGPEELTYNELTDKISQILGVKRIKIFIPLILFEICARLFHLLGINALVYDQIPRLLCKKSADISLARKDLNFNPRTVEEGIRTIISTR